MRIRYSCDPLHYLRTWSVDLSPAFCMVRRVAFEKALVQELMCKKVGIGMTVVLNRARTNFPVSDVKYNSDADVRRSQREPVQKPVQSCRDLALVRCPKFPSLGGGVAARICRARRRRR